MHLAFNAEYVVKKLGSDITSKGVNAHRERLDFPERTELQQSKDALS